MQITFTVTKCKLHTKQVQGAHFENGFRMEKVVVYFCPQSLKAKPFPRLFIFTQAKLLLNSLRKHINSSISFP